MPRMPISLTALATASSALFLLIAPIASAEFIANSSKGNGEVVEMTVEAGGGTVVCDALTESASKATWTIKTEGGAASDKGPRLGYAVSNWGKCDVSSGSLKEVEATMGACEQEVKSPGEQLKVTGTVLSACTVKVAGGCEITVASEGNKALKEVLLESAGAESENMIMQYALTGVTTKASGCLGVESSSTGKVSGSVELLSVQPTPLRPTMTLGGTQVYTAGAPNGTITITNTGPTQQVLLWSLLETPGTPFTLEPTELAACKKKTFTNRETCPFKAMSNRAGTLTIAIQSQSNLGAARPAWDGIDLRRS